MRFRDYKIFRSGYYYHVYNRGNARNDIFHDGSDYIQFLKRLKIVLGISSAHHISFKDNRGRSLSLTALPRQAFTIAVYCLMPNHFHFLIRQNSEVGVDRLISKLCTSYAAYYNRKYEHVGHVFQDTFKAKLVDFDEYIIYLSAYIHNNPADVLTYPYSSFLDYVGNRGGTICDQGPILSYFNDKKSYKDFVLSYNRKMEARISNLLFDE